MNGKEPKVTRGIVAMLDALGIRNASIEEILKFVEFMPKIEEIAKLTNPGFVASNLHVKELGNDKNFIIYRFGDTVLLVWKITTPGDELVGLVPIAKVLSLVIKAGLVFGIRLRGAVSVGDMILDEHSVLGPVINDVASWYDKTEFIGVIATPQCGQLLSYIEYNPVKDGFTSEQSLKCELYASFQKYDVPIKDNSARKLWVVNWPNRINFNGQDPLGWYFDQTRKTTIPFETEQKYQNTENFIIEMLKRGVKNQKIYE